VAALAFGADFADAAEGHDVKGLIFVVEMVDDHAWIEFAENQAIVRFRVAPPPGVGVLLGVRHRLRYR
jgi:hypothetical protein